MVVCATLDTKNEEERDDKILRLEDGAVLDCTKELNNINPKRSVRSPININSAKYSRYAAKNVVTFGPDVVGEFAASVR